MDKAAYADFKEAWANILPGGLVAALEATADVLARAYFVGRRRREAVYK